MKANKTGLARIFAAFFYSADGMKAAVAGEAAFRQELFLYCLFLPAIYLLPVPFPVQCLLFSLNTLVLIVELLNSALESVVDLVSPDFHPLAKQAKDMGSAAVLLALVLTILVWTRVIVSII